MADLYCEVEDLPEHVAKDCGGDAAGIVAIALIEPSVDFVLGTSPEQIEMASAWQTLIDDGLIHIINNTRGEQAKPAVTESEGFGRKSTQVTGRDHEVTVEVLGIKENQVLMNRLNRRTDLKLAYLTMGGLLHFTDAPVTIDAGNVIDRDIKAWEYHAITFKWSHFDLPFVFTEPEGIFA